MLCNLDIFAIIVSLYVIFIVIDFGIQMGKHSAPLVA